MKPSDVLGVLKDALEKENNPLSPLVHSELRDDPPALILTLWDDEADGEYAKLQRTYRIDEHGIVDITSGEPAAAGRQQLHLGP